MDEREAFAKLRTVLASLYDDAGSIQRVAFDAGLDAAHLALSQRTLDNWHVILQEAKKRRRLAQLISIALNEYPEHLELQDAWETYQTVSNGKRVEIKPKLNINAPDPRTDHSITVGQKPAPVTASFTLVRMAGWVLGLVALLLLAVWGRNALFTLASGVFAPMAVPTVGAEKIATVTNAPSAQTVSSPTVPTVAATATPLPSSTANLAATQTAEANQIAMAVAATLTAQPPNTATPTTAEPAAGATKSMKDITFVYVPAGEFTMGSSITDTLAYPDERPQHKVVLDGFWIMQTEVTNAQYAKCVAAGACDKPANDFWEKLEFAQYPVVNVDWTQASAYATWVGGRLPTEAEWEKAARGTDGRIYPWGNEAPDASRCNCEGRESGTTPVGQYPEGASPYGALDMAGNVWEWVADWYGDDYYKNSPKANPLGPISGDRRVLRGGAWDDYQSGVRCAFRILRLVPGGGLNFVGFRVVAPGSGSLASGGMGAKSPHPP